MIDITDKDGAVVFGIRVIPRASRTEFVGEYDGSVRIKVASPPVEGAANEELIRFFAKRLGVAKSRVEIVSGLASRTKRLRISGVTTEEVRRIVGA